MERIGKSKIIGEARKEDKKIEKKPLRRNRFVIKKPNFNSDEDRKRVVDGLFYVHLRRVMISRSLKIDKDVLETEFDSGNF